MRLQLETTYELPPREMFTSDLKKEPLSKEEYTRLTRLFKENCFTLGDYLELYAKADVGDFVKSISKWIKFYNSEDICILRHGISIPAISQRLWMQTVDPNVVFFLATKFAENLQKTLKRGIVGGLATVCCYLSMHLRKMNKTRRYSTDCTCEG